MNNTNFSAVVTVLPGPRSLTAASSATPSSVKILLLTFGIRFLLALVLKFLLIVFFTLVEASRNEKCGYTKMLTAK